MDARATGAIAGSDADAPDEAFRHDVLVGLSRQPKVIPARWLYDDLGSELFEQITGLPEYYPTRTEISILEAHGADIAELVGPNRAVVEFGAGSAAKTPLLLDRVAPAAYVAIDIAGDFLRESCKALEARYPGLRVIAVEGDFMQPIAIPDEAADDHRLGFFPGSTIGNMQPDAAVDLLRRMHATLGEGSMLLIGMDCIKEADVLVPAYDDAAGVTAEFNLNLARRINRELDGTIPVEALRHKAVWNDERGRIEMHLEATQDIAFEVCGRAFSMRAGETVHTENSHKYDARTANQLLLAGYWEPLRRYSDPAGNFMVIVARALREDRVNA